MSEGEIKKQTDLSELEGAINSIGEAVGSVLGEASLLLSEVRRRPLNSMAEKSAAKDERVTNNRIQDLTAQVGRIKANVYETQGAVRNLRAIVGDFAKAAT